jgi:hypothetical protein
VSDAIIYNSVLETLEKNRLAAEKANPAAISARQFLLPLNPDNWAELVPKLDDTGLPSDTPAGTSGVFCVWDPTYNRCQSTCTWTVPAGVTKAGFQLWGGGGGSAGGCCCGGHPGGSTGEFVSVVMDVNPGDVYILCNTCNYCCTGRRGGIQIDAALACITGPGITCLRADGGCGTLCSWSCSWVNTDSNRQIAGYSPTAISYDCFDRAGSYMTGSTLCFNRWIYPSSKALRGSEFCNSGYDYCFTNSCQTDGEIPWIASHCTRTPTVIDEARNPLCGWIPRRWNAMCYDTNHYGYLIYAPTVCFGPSGATTQKHPGSDCCTTYDSGTCCGSLCSTASQGGLTAPFGCMPGHGSVYTHSMGGSNNVCGDTGRGAAIRVTYC